MHCPARSVARWGGLLFLGLVTFWPIPGKTDETSDSGFIPKADVEKKEEKKKKKKTKDGWHPSLKVGLNFNMSQARNVVGVADGTTLALGLNLDSALIFRHGPHQWRNSLTILQTQTKVPNLKPFIKSADKLEVESFYLYALPSLKWLGFFGGLRLTTPLFSGNYVSDTDTTLELTDTEDVVTQDTAVAQKYYRLTKPFTPLLFRQFVGAIFLPLEKKWMKLDVRVGPGALETWSRSGYVVDDDEDTEEVVELTQLEDFVQIGGEIQVAAVGVIVKDTLSYTLKAGAMYPFYTSADTDIEGIDLLNVELAFNLSIKLSKWAALNYSLSALRVPMVVDKWQVTNNLMLSLTANLGT